MRAWVIVLATVLAVGLPADAQFRTSRGQAKVGGPIHATQPSTGAAASTLTFDLQPSSGTSNLSTTLSTVTGSVALDPVVVCNLSNATADNIACTGATLTRQGVSPTLAASAPFTDSSTSVDFSTAQDEYVAANNTVGNVTTEDFVVEAVVRGTSGSAAIGKKDVPTGADAGWVLYAPGSTSGAVVRIGDGTSSAVGSAVSVGSTTWYHAICFVKRGDAAGMRCAVNGTLGSAVSTVPVAGSLTNSLTLAVGSNESTETATDFNGRVAWAAVWKCPAGNTACLATADYAALAQERASRFWLGAPAKALGTAYATTMFRNTNGQTIDIANTTTGVRSLHYIGAGAPRVGRRASGASYYTGILVEKQRTNLILQSDVFNTTWVPTNVGISANIWTSPADFAHVDGLEGTDGAGDVEHYVRQTTASALTATTHTFSVWAGPGAAYVWLRNNTIADGVAWFNLSTCTAATVQAGISSTTAEGNWSGQTPCRVSITFTGTTATHDLDIGYSTADNDLAFDEGTNGATDLYLFGAQLEANNYPTTYIPTTTAAATANVDDFRFEAVGNAPQAGTVAASVICPSHDSSTNSFLTVGNSTAEYFDLRGNNNDLTNGSASLSGGVTQWNIIGPAGADITNGAPHELRLAYDTNAVEAWYDSVSAGTDTTAVVQTIDSSDTIRLGTSWSAAAPTAGCISTRVRFWSDRQAP
jgi:hypothetical protein